MDALPLSDFPEIVYAVEATSSGDVYVAGPKKSVPTLVVFGPDGKTKSSTALGFDLREIVHDDASGSFWLVTRNGEVHCTDKSGKTAVARISNVQHLVPIAGGRALLHAERSGSVPPIEGSFSIARCGFAELEKTTKIEDKTYVSGPVSDGRGGIYASLSRFDGGRSFSIVRMTPEGAFSAWVSKETTAVPLADKAVSLAPLGTDGQEPLTVLREPLPDGAGGLWIASDKGVFRLGADGKVTLTGTPVPGVGAYGSGFEGWVLDAETSRPIAIAKNATGGRSLHFFQDAGVVRVIEIPADVARALGRDVAWIAPMRGGVLVHGTEGIARFSLASGWRTWIAPGNAALAESNEKPQSSSGGHPEVLVAFAAGLAATAAGGAAGASSFHDEKFGRTFAEAGVGGLVGAAPNVLLVGGAIGLSYSVGEKGAAAEIGSTFSTMSLAFGLILGPPITALGTYGTGELAFEGSKNGAFLGTLGGAYVGSAAAIAVSILGRSLWRSPDIWLPILVGVASGLVSSGATMGYHLAGGGPPP